MSDTRYIKKIKIKQLSFYTELVHNGFELLDIPILYHCNLNCAYCNFMAPLQDKYFVNVEDFRKNINRLSKILPSNKFKKIHILGGEPLLHPDINLFFKYTRDSFPDKEIFLITNGLLLDKMEEDFKLSVFNNKIKILVSDYSILKNKEQLIEEYLKYKIELGFEEKGPFKQKLIDLEGKQDPYKNLDICTKGCINLSLIEDKLYMCTYPYFGEKAFGKYMTSSLSDHNEGESVYLSSSFEEIINKLISKYPLKCCNYCKLPTISKEWHLSKNPLLEYTDELY